MKAKLLIIISCLIMLGGCCSYSRYNDDFDCSSCGGGCSACSVAYAQPATCETTHSCYDEGCAGRACGHEYDNIGQFGCPTCSTAYTSRKNCWN